MLTVTRPHGKSGVALLELLVSTGAAIAIIGALVTASVSISRSITATRHYTTNATSQSRIMDYIAQDLRRAVRVGTLIGGASTPFRTQQNFAITNTNVLTIDVPDFYAGNTPDNTAGSAYKTPRYPRATLDTTVLYNSSANLKLNGVVPWQEAAVLFGPRYLTRFAPASAGDGTIQVRYSQRIRASGDPTMCFFRAEYPSGSSTASDMREIAESVSEETAGTSVILSALSNGAGFRIQSSFTPRYRAGSESTTAWLEVTLRNPRRD